MKMLQHSFTLGFTLLALLGNAKGTPTGQLVGKVIEKETMQVLAYAEIVLENGTEKITLTANEYGYYYAEHLHTGKYQMSIVFNNRTFVMNKVRVYESFTGEINFMVSNNQSLPETVEVLLKDNGFSYVTTRDTKMANSTMSQVTHSLSVASIGGN